MWETQKQSASIPSIYGDIGDGLFATLYHFSGQVGMTERILGFIVDFKGRQYQVGRLIKKMQTYMPALMPMISQPFPTDVVNPMNKNTNQHKSTIITKW